MMARMMSLAVTPSGSLPSTRRAPCFLRLALDQRLRRPAHARLRTCRWPCGERARNAPWVEVWLVAAHDRGAGQREALLRTDDVHDALTQIVLAVILDAEFLGVLGHPRGSVRRRFSRGRDWAGLRSEVGILWSTTASVFSGARTLRPRRAQNPRTPAGSSHLVHQMAVDVEQGRCRPAVGRPCGRPRSCHRGCGGFAIGLLFSGHAVAVWTLFNGLRKQGESGDSNRLAAAAGRKDGITPYLPADFLC